MTEDELKTFVQKLKSIEQFLTAKEREVLVAVLRQVVMVESGEVRGFGPSTPSAVAQTEGPCRPAGPDWIDVLACGWGIAAPAPKSTITSVAA
jgi:hypothetical protein